MGIDALGLYSSRGQMTYGAEPNRRKCYAGLERAWSSCHFIRQNLPNIKIRVPLHCKDDFVALCKG